MATGAIATHAPPAEATSLSARGVTVRFHGVAALEGVTFELRRGEIVGLIGPNGAGKTTFLNVLSGYQLPHEGDVLCGGSRLTGASPDRMARHGIARTFQNVRSFERLSVRENVALGALGHGRGRRAAARVADELLDEFGLADDAERPAAALPYGKERLLGIARALAGDPAFLLLDEPAAGLDEAEGGELIERIRALRARYGCGVLLVEHDMHLIASLSERVHVLDYGKTLAAGTLEEVRRNPDVVEAYFGTKGAADARA